MWVSHRQIFNGKCIQLLRLERIDRRLIMIHAVHGYRETLGISRTSVILLTTKSPTGAGTHTIDQALVLFDRPASVTGFLRANRGVDSEIDDSFTILLQYGEQHKNLLVTIKTAVVTHMRDQLKYLVRGTKGTYLKVGLIIYRCSTAVCDI